MEDLLAEVERQRFQATENYFFLTINISWRCKQHDIVNFLRKEKNSDTIDPINKLIKIQDKKACLNARVQ